jgi:hypothetical protein
LRKNSAARRPKFVANGKAAFMVSTTIIIIITTGAKE